MIHLLCGVLVGAAALAQPDAARPFLEAVRVEEGAVEVDGEFSEAVWRDAAPAADFRQREPGNGEPATERTEVRVLYDGANLYFAVLCLDAEPSRILADEQRRDADLQRNDSVQIILDTFHDFRNGYVFETNALGARYDATFIWGMGGFTSPRVEWDGVWEVSAKVTPRGWQAEIRIPFSTLRFDPKKSAWGLTLVRRIHHKNETASWPFLPREQNILKLSLAGELRGIRGVRHRKALEVKPYALASAARMPSAGTGETDFSATVGVDAKWRLTPNLTADLTVNTDFSQTEVDAQQINLTRFPLFFPEKREFFLEAAENFEFGRKGIAQPFFSRRIGLAGGETVPILGGVKLSGKIARTRVGFLSVHTNQHALEGGGLVPETNFTVARLKRDIFTRSGMGFIYVGRETFGRGDVNDGYNCAFGVDADFQFFKNSAVTAFVSRTQSPGLDGDDYAGQILGSWNNALWTFAGSHIVIGENYNPEVGFAPRRGVVRTSPFLMFTPRPNTKRLRDVFIAADLEYWTDSAHNLLTRVSSNEVTFKFQNGAYLSVDATGELEVIETPFEISPGVVIAPGTYSFWRGAAGGASDPRKKWGVQATVSAGEFYDGDSASASVKFQWVPNEHFFSRLECERREIRLPAGAFNADLAGLRLNYSFNTRLSVSSFTQFNSTTDDVSANVRLRWTYRDGSDLFIVYNERRDVEGSAPRLADRSLVIKVTLRMNAGQ